MCLCLVHIACVHLLCLVWINNVHIGKCIIGVHLHCFVFDIVAWAFMFKLLMTLQPLKNFKDKYLFGDKILKRDGASSSHTHNNIFLPIPFGVEPHYEVMNLNLAQENITLTNKIKKAYEMNMHFQDTWVMKFPWAKSILGSNGKVVQIQCKVCSLINGKNNLMVAKLDSLWKHASGYEALVVMSGVKVGEHYFLKSNAHVAKKFYFAKSSETML